MTKCDVCKEDLFFRWTDYHGVAQCSTCGAPYRLIHRDREGKIEKDERGEDKPPKLILSKEGKDLASEYWEEFGKRMPSGFSIGFADTRGAQEVATKAEAEAFYSWLNTKLPEENKEIRDNRDKDK